MWLNFILFFGYLLHSQTVLSSWTCTLDSDCSDAVGAICSAGNCACPSGQQMIFGNSLCVDAPPYLASSCFENHQCSRLVTNFECRGSGDGQEGQCLCREGFHYQNGRCWRSTDYGDPCIRDEDCYGVKRDPFSMSCDATSRTCGCAAGFYRRQRGECRLIALAVGESCVLDEDCQFENGRCNIREFQCYNSTDGTNAITAKVGKPIAAQELTIQQDGGLRSDNDSSHGVPCSATNDCPSPYMCSTFGSCICSDGYYWSGVGDICYAELGSPSTPEQCVGFLAEVRGGLCTCPANFFFEDDMRNCIKVTRTLTDFCLTDIMCHTFGTAARCTDPFPPWGLRNCECTPGISVWDESRSLCRIFVGIGDACEANSDCLAGDLEIECAISADGEGVCRCPATTVEDNGLCLTLGLELGATCQVSRECTGTAHTECTDGTCSCGAAYYELDGRCAPAIGGVCIMDADCLMENSLCRPFNDGWTCQCADGHLSVRGTCLPVLSDQNSICNATEQCVLMMGENSVCENSRCSCTPGHHFRDGNCWPVVGLFGDCSRTSECFLQDISERVVCRNSLCQCSFNFPYSEALNTCSSATSVTMGSLFALLLTLNYLLTN